MEIIVEIGTDEQKDLIRSELYIIEKLSREMPSLNIKKVVIANDFDKTVNELQNTSSYKSLRGQLAVGKIVNIDSGIAIIISPFLFTDGFDYQVRCIFYLHEIMHAANKQWLKEPKTDSASMFRTVTNINTFYDEYSANRKAFEIVKQIFPTKTYLLRRFISTTFNGHIKSLINDDIYYNYIKIEILKFRFHGDVVCLLKNIGNFFDEASKDIVYSYAYMDTFERLKRIEPILSRSKFINEKTLSLINFFRMVYLGDNDDLTEGIALMEDFMTNFGMKFEDIPEGEYCHILDI